MNDPELYKQFNNIQKSDAKLFLEGIKHKLTWSKEEKILDVGCGPGDVTVKLLGEYLPDDASLVGCDISEPMIKHAEANYASDRINFSVVDIGKPSSWVDSHRGKFDKIFSFHCIHWVKDQVQAVKNLYDLLKEGGELNLMFALQSSAFELFREIPKMDKWKKYTNDPWWETWNAHNNDNTLKEKKNEFNKILTTNNFEILSNELVKKEYPINSMDDYMDILAPVLPFKKILTENEYKNFTEDCKNYFLTQGLVPRTADGRYLIQYDTVLTHARKHRIKM